MNKYIIVREAYDYIVIGDNEDELTTIEYNKLCRYFNEHYNSNLIEHSFNKFRFINYVGIINIDNVVIEILPKISLTNDINKDREVLIRMLVKCRRLPIQINNSLSTENCNVSLIDLLGKLYANALFKELKKGIYHEYVNVEENLNTIKGKLLLTTHIKKNAFNKTKVYCKYDEFLEDNYLNKIFKLATSTLLICVKDEKVKNILNNIIIMLEAVDCNTINLNKLNIYKLNRQNARFKDAFNIAKLILNNSFMKNTIGKDNGFNILYEMNYLYEEYIGVLLKEICNKEEQKIVTQETGKYLLNNNATKKEQVALRPDIILYENNKPKIILDTKWKSVLYKERENYSQADIYQMYAYVTRYKECEKCILLYPKISDEYTHSSWSLNEPFNDKSIIIEEVSLENQQETLENLKNIIGEE